MGDTDGGLAAAIGRLDRTQHIKPAKRTESRTGATLEAKSLSKLLSSQSNLKPLAQQLKTPTENALSRPLEKHKADFLRRGVGFEEITVKLDRWNAVVACNRASDHKEFPLTDPDEVHQAPDAYLDKFRLNSKLEEELKELEPPEAEKEEQTFPLTMAEMIEHRKEMARLRAKQSYQESKAKRQGKIKSKKFHRVQRKEKIKAQLKEFEALQKTDPELALKKLEEIEKTRAEERVTLRHKNTGQWAKNKLVRARYNKETRQELSQQLALSRELTEKIKPSEESESDEDMDVAQGEINSDNPWLRTNEGDGNSDITGGYKKYWQEFNEFKSNMNDEDDDGDKDEFVNNAKVVNTRIELKNKLKKKSSLKRKISKKDIKPKFVSTTEWEVEIVQHNSDEKEAPISIDGIFDKLNVKTNEPKVKGLKKSTRSRRKSKVQEEEGVSKLSELSFPNQSKRIQIDEPLLETADTSDQIDQLKKSIDALVKPTVANRDMIDPNNFVAPKPKHLSTAIPDVEISEDFIDDEADPNAKNKLSIMEAFEDDDIVTKFEQEKNEDIEKNKPVIDDAFMPGWGSWTGKNMQPPKRKQQRKIFNIPKIPRKDDRKDFLIVNEDKSDNLRSHQVSELPFPFTSVSDFEATIRAPLGSTFIPESAHKKLTKPSVSVKTGIVIKPMDESQLLPTDSSRKKTLQLYT